MKTQKTQTRRIHTRKLDRMVAKNNIIKDDRKDKARGDGKTHGYLHHFIKSGLFAKTWRTYAGKEG